MCNLTHSWVPENNVGIFAEKGDHHSAYHRAINLHYCKMIYVSKMWNKGTSKIKASELSLTLDLEEITDTVADHIREGIPGQRLLMTQAARCANLKPPWNLSFKNKGRGQLW